MATSLHIHCITNRTGQYVIRLPAKKTELGKDYLHKEHAIRLPYKRASPLDPRRRQPSAPRTTQMTRHLGAPSKNSYLTTISTQVHLDQSFLVQITRATAVSTSNPNARWNKKTNDVCFVY
jgi:hypothetical protein